MIPLTPKQMAKFIGVSTCTLITLEKKGYLHSTRNENNARQYDETALEEAKKIKKKFYTP